jgi:hypothetical protein
VIWRRPGAMFCCTGRVPRDHHTAGHDGGGGPGSGRLCGARASRDAPAHRVVLVSQILSLPVIVVRLAATTEHGPDPSAPGPLALCGACSHAGSALLQWAAHSNTKSQVTLRARPLVGDTEEVADAKSGRKPLGDELTSYGLWELFPGGAFGAGPPAGRTEAVVGLTAAGRPWPRLRSWPRPAAHGTNYRGHTRLLSQTPQMKLPVTQTSSGCGSGCRARAAFGSHSLAVCT